MKVPERRPNKWLSLFAWLLPSCRFKLWALRSLGNQIGSDVVLGPNLVVGCGRFEIADGGIDLTYCFSLVGSLCPIAGSVIDEPAGSTQVR